LNDVALAINSRRRARPSAWSHYMRYLLRRVEANNTTRMSLLRTESASDSSRESDFPWMGGTFSYRFVDLASRRSSTGCASQRVPLLTTEPTSFSSSANMGGPHWRPDVDTQLYPSSALPPRHTPRSEDGIFVKRQTAFAGLLFAECIAAGVEAPK